MTAAPGGGPSDREPADPWFAAVLRATLPAEDQRFTGVRHETGPRGERVETFEIQGASRWRAGAATSPWSGVITDGTTHTIVRDGVAVHVGTAERPAPPLAVREVRARSTYDWRGVEVISREEIEHAGRAARRIQTQLRTKDGHRRMVLIVDRVTGVLLSLTMVGTPFVTELRGFEVLPASDGRFVWDGPMQPSSSG